MNRAEKSRRKFLKKLKDLRQGKIDRDKVPVPGRSGELKGSSVVKNHKLQDGICEKSKKYENLIGKRVRHVCEDPNCPLKGKVLKVVYLPDITKSGEYFEWWAVVRWEPHGNLPKGYKQPVPINRVEMIL